MKLFLIFISLFFCTIEAGYTFPLSVFAPFMMVKNTVASWISHKEVDFDSPDVLLQENFEGPPKKDLSFKAMCISLFLHDLKRKALYMGIASGLCTLVYRSQIFPKNIQHVMQHLNSKRAAWIFGGVGFYAMACAGFELDMQNLAIKELKKEQAELLKKQGEILVLNETLNTRNLYLGRSLQKQARYINTLEYKQNITHTKFIHAKYTQRMKIAQYLAENGQNISTKTSQLTDKENNELDTQKNLELTIVSWQKDQVIKDQQQLIIRQQERALQTNQFLREVRQEKNEIEKLSLGMQHELFSQIGVLQAQRDLAYQEVDSVRSEYEKALQKIKYCTCRQRESTFSLLSFFCKHHKNRMNEESVMKKTVSAPELYALEKLKFSEINDLTEYEEVIS